MAKLIFKQAFIDEMKRELKKRIRQFELKEINLPDPDRNQCHICTRFQTVDNPLFAYSIRDNGDFIWRCKKGHSHDHGMIYMDIHTGLEVHC